MKIAFIQTGGTIDKDYPHAKNGWAFEIGSPAFIRILKQAQHQHELSFYELFKKDSLEITHEDRIQLKNYITQLTEETIIITHGSDTLLDTAKVLANIPQKTILLTAAMLPEKFKDSDAAFNLGMAIGGAQTLEAGIYIAIHGYLADWQKFDRNMETGKYSLK
jgi:L-asparaginase